MWVIDPESRSVKIYRGDGSIRRVREGDELSGEDIIPGFRCPVREILPQHEPSPTGHANPNGAAEPGQPNGLKRLSHDSPDRRTGGDHRHDLVRHFEPVSR